MNRSVTPVCHPVPPPPQRRIPLGLLCYLSAGATLVSFVSLAIIRGYLL